MIIAVLQARMSSSRLPGKVLKPILGKPMLALQIERIQRVKQIDKIILATSTEPADDALVDLAKTLKIESYQGSLDNVLARFYHAASPYSPHHVVRLTGDCPLTDPALIDQLIDLHLKGNFDYSSIAPSFPDGLDAEIMKWPALVDAYQSAQLPSEKEHVTLFINQRPDRYAMGSFRNEQDYSHLRWTVDEQKDFELISKIYAALYPKNPHFSWLDILNFVKANPPLMTYNTQYQRNEGLQKSLLKDQAFLKGQ